MKKKDLKLLNRQNFTMVNLFDEILNIIKVFLGDVRLGIQSYSSFFYYLISFLCFVIVIKLLIF